MLSYYKRRDCVKTGKLNINNTLYETMRDGFQIEIQIVDHCNLNCGGCNHFSCVAEPYYISLEEFEENLKVISKWVPSLKRLMLVGGEPFLHPQIEEIAILMRKYFPDFNFMIDILTNGIALEKKDDDFFSRMQKLKIGILWTPYPNINYKKTEEIFNWRHDESHKNESPITPLYSRMFFAQPALNLKGDSNINDLYNNCPYYMIPTLIVRKSKIYICPKSACIDIINKKFNLDIPTDEKDYIPISEASIDKLQAFFDKGPSQMCRFCERKIEYFYWHLYRDSFKDLRMYDNHTMSAKNLFLHHYDMYDKLVNGKEIFQYFLKTRIVENRSYWDLTDPVYGHDFVNPQINRIKGYMDILIPIYYASQDQMTALIRSLQSQTIINKCHIYIVYDGEDLLFKERLYDTFKSAFQNITFLSTEINSGPGVARQMGIDNSFNKYIFQIDCDDQIIGNNSLELLWNILEKNESIDILCGRVRSYDLVLQQPCLEESAMSTEKFPNDVHGFCYRRSFIEKHQIKYKPFYLNEDLDLFYQIVSKNANMQRFEREIYLYQRCSPHSLGQRTSKLEKIMYFLVSTMIGLREIYNSNYLSQEDKDWHLQNSILGLLELGGLRQISELESQDTNNVIIMYFQAAKYALENYTSEKNLMQIQNIIKSKHLEVANVLINKFLNKDYVFFTEGKVYSCGPEVNRLTYQYLNLSSKLNILPNYCFWLSEK